VPEDVRTYLYLDNDDETPIGHREGGDWVHYVKDANGTPSDVIDPTGRLLNTFERSVFGHTEAGAGVSTPFRFPGQQEDAETGLHYNRYRYYDPATGRYISPDPIGLEGGLNFYSYGPNPVAWVDPMGWDAEHGDDKHYMTVTSDAPDFQNKNDFPNALGSGAPGQYASGYSSGRPKGQQCPNGLETDAKCHTEQKFATDLLNKSKLDGKSRGKRPGHKAQTFNLTGTMPPCPNCHTALMRAAQQTGATIKYNFGGKTITYKGNGLSKQPSVDFGDTGSSRTKYSKLAAKYDKIKLAEDDKGNVAPWSMPDGDYGSQTDKNAAKAGKKKMPDTGPKAKDYWGQEPGSSAGATKAYQDMPAP
jgi:RHS repeat-associated protein